MLAPSNTMKNITPMPFNVNDTFFNAHKKPDKENVPLSGYVNPRVGFQPVISP